MASREARSVSRQRAYQIRHRAAGLCSLCPRKAVPSSFCRRHRPARGRAIKSGPAADTVAAVAVIAYLCGKGLSPREIAALGLVREQSITARIAYYRKRGWLPRVLNIPRAAYTLREERS